MEVFHYLAHQLRRVPLFESNAVDGMGEKEGAVFNDYEYIPDGTIDTSNLLSSFSCPSNTQTTESYDIEDSISQAIGRILEENQSSNSSDTESETDEAGSSGDEDAEGGSGGEKDAERESAEEEHSVRESGEEEDDEGESDDEEYERSSVDMEENCAEEEKEENEEKEEQEQEQGLTTGNEKHKDGITSKKIQKNERMAIEQNEDEGEDEDVKPPVWKKPRITPLESIVISESEDDIKPGQAELKRFSANFRCNSVIVLSDDE